MGQQFWVGGYWNNDEWHWTDGTPWQYQSWIPGEPNNERQRCTRMFNKKDYRWDDEWCTFNYRFFCQRGQREQIFYWKLIKRKYWLDFACPSGWKSYGTECYKLHEEELTWEEARTTCQQKYQVNDIDLYSFLIMEIHTGVTGNSRKWGDLDLFKNCLNQVTWNLVGRKKELSLLLW